MLQLHLVSARPESRGRRLRAYDIRGEQIVGAFGDEPFEIHVENPDHVRREMTISVDGINVLTGQKATLEDTRRFVIEPYKTAVLEAWPETTAGGRKFVFVSAANSASVHAIADETMRGIIALAVFKEGYVEPQRLERSFASSLEGITRGAGGGTLGGNLEGLRGGSGVGAGDYTQQRIGQTHGLRKPVFEASVQVRHMWWDELRALLEREGIQPPAPMAPPAGFFSAGQPLANLGSTPTVGQPPPPARPATIEYPRFA